MVNQGTAPAGIPQFRYNLKSRRLLLQHLCYVGGFINELHLRALHNFGALKVRHLSLHHDRCVQHTIKELNLWHSTVCCTDRMVSLQTSKVYLVGSLQVVVQRKCFPASFQNGRRTILCRVRTRENRQFCRSQLWSPLEATLRPCDKNLLR